MVLRSRGAGQAALILVCVLVLCTFLTAAAWLVGDALVDLVRGLVAED